MEKHNLKRRRKYTGTCVIINVSPHCAETSITMLQCYNFARRQKGTIIRIKKALSSIGSVVGIAWVSHLGCDGVYQGWPCRWRRFLPLRHLHLSNCTLSHPKHGILIFSARKSLA